MDAQQRERIAVHLRWMIRRDMEEVLAIEDACFAYPWQIDDFIRYLRQRNTIGRVAEHKDRIVGYWIYSLEKTRLSIENLAVHPRFQRCGIGSQIMAELRKKLTPNRRFFASTVVRESNIEALQFFRSCGWTATALLHNRYDDTDDDGVQMLLRPFGRPEQFIQRSPR